MILLPNNKANAIWECQNYLKGKCWKTYLRIHRDMIKSKSTFLMGMQRNVCPSGWIRKFIEIGRRQMAHFLIWSRVWVKFSETKLVSWSVLDGWLPLKRFSKGGENERATWSCYKSGSGRFERYLLLTKTLKVLKGQMMMYENENGPDEVTRTQILNMMRKKDWKFGDGGGEEAFHCH